MINRLFTHDQISILLHPEQWRLITPWQAPKQPARGRHQKWYETHYQLHSHREVLIGLSGQTPYGMGAGLVNVQPGTVMIFDSMARHQDGYPAFTPNIDHLWISLLPEVFTARVLKIHKGRIQTQAAAMVLCDPADLGLALTPRALGLEPTKHTPSLLRKTRMWAAVSYMAASIVECGYRPASKREPHAEQARMILTIQEHLRKTAGHGDSVASLARVAGCSSFHFMRLFKRHTGRTILEFINLCRIQKTATLLAKNISHKEISYELGFSCPQTFSRWFHKHADACEAAKITE